MFGARCGARHANEEGDPPSRLPPLAAAAEEQLGVEKRREKGEASPKMSDVGQKTVPYLDLFCALPPLFLCGHFRCGSPLFLSSVCCCRSSVGVGVVRKRS